MGVGDALAQVESALAARGITTSRRKDPSGREVLVAALPKGMENPVAPYTCFLAPIDGGYQYLAQHDSQTPADPVMLDEYIAALNAMFDGLPTVSRSDGFVWTEQSLSVDDAAAAADALLCFQKACSLVSIGLWYVVLRTPVPQTMAVLQVVRTGQ